MKGFTLLLVLTITCVATGLVCQYHDPQKCEGGVDKQTKKPCGPVKTCDKPEPNKRAHCYALWENDTTNGVQIKIQGCWLDDERCYDTNTCVSHQHKPNHDLIFCCCEGNFCNNQTFWEPVEPQSTPSPLGDVPATAVDQGEPLVMTLLYSVIPLLAISVIVALSYYLWRRHKYEFAHCTPPQDDPLLPPPPTPIQKQAGVQLIEVKARGRFGCVWKGQLGPKLIAVKILPLSDRQSFDVERLFYELPRVSEHPNILKFLGAETHREDAVNTELWLLSEFHARGSLYDHLKGSLVSLPQLLQLAVSMVDGLAFLHQEFQGPDGLKPSVAHRDFKSKNVLVKTDGTACLADFGLALNFYTGEVGTDTHGQVGTRRYMAPEVLEGAINFDRESFLRIDMYACGLVLWEMVTRCSVVDGPVGDYRLPFEAEVGAHPTLEEMQETVVLEKKRPVIREAWRENKVLSELCDSITECWDEDCESRLAAHCVLQRLLDLQSQLHPTAGGDTDTQAQLPGNDDTQQPSNDTMQQPANETAPLTHVVAPPPPSMTMLPSNLSMESSSGSLPLPYSGLLQNYKLAMLSSDEETLPPNVEVCSRQPLPLRGDYGDADVPHHGNGHFITGNGIISMPPDTRVAMTTLLEPSGRVVHGVNNVTCNLPRQALGEVV